MTADTNRSDTEKYTRDEVKRRMQNPSKPNLPPLRTFRITRLFPMHNGDHITHEQGIEAHRVEQADNGNLTFYRYTDVEMTPEGLVYSFKIQRLVAAGTYTDLEEVTDQYVTQSTN